MALQYSDKLIPHHRRGAEVLLESVDYKIDKLTPEQVAAIRRLYFLDDSRSVSQRMIEDGDKEPILTNGMEAETEAINKFQRGDLP